MKYREICADAIHWRYATAVAPVVVKGDYARNVTYARGPDRELEKGDVDRREIGYRGGRERQQNGWAFSLCRFVELAFGETLL